MPPYMTLTRTHATMTSTARILSTIISTFDMNFLRRWDVSECLLKISDSSVLLFLWWLPE